MAEEYIWLGLRTSRGFDRNVLAERYNYKCDTKQNKRLESMVKDGKIRQSGERFSSLPRRLTNSRLYSFGLDKLIVLDSFITWCLDNTPMHFGSFALSLFSQHFHRLGLHV